MIFINYSNLTVYEVQFLKYLSNEKGKLQYIMKIAIHYESNIYNNEYFSDYNDCYIEIIICIPCIPCIPLI